VIKLKDGPAARAYATKLAPDFLRAVVAADGGLDVLDLPSDAPVDGETVYVYRRVSDVIQVHISGVHLRGFFSSADYEFMPEVDGESLRDNRAWRRWLGGQG